MCDVEVGPDMVKENIKKISDVIRVSKIMIICDILLIFNFKKLLQHAMTSPNSF